MHNVLSMGVILGEDEGLGDFGAAWEDFRDFLLEGADDGANLVRGCRPWWGLAGAPGPGGARTG